MRLGVRDAEGPIARAVELLVDLDEGRTTVLTDLGLVMDPAAMLHVEEQRPGVIDVEVELRRRGCSARRGRVVQVLAAQQWLATPLPLALEMLAAHVMPNHPAITALVAEAADAARASRPAAARSTATPHGPERVDEIVAALAARHARAAASATASRRASWSDLGQQVRSPGDVLTWRVGTPLDTVVVLAAALEQAGIRPLLWLADGHAFLGYWREERSAESAATTDAAPLVNLVDLGLIGLVETTLLTSMGEPGADLHRPAYADVADRRARPDPRRHRRPPGPPRRHRAAARPRPGRRPASCRSSSTGRRCTARRRRRPRRRPAPAHRARGAARGCSSGRTRCST